MSNGVNVKDILIEDQSMDTVGNMVIFFYVFLLINFFSGIGVVL